MSTPPKPDSSKESKAPKVPRMTTAPNLPESPMHNWGTAVEGVVRQEVRAGNLDLSRTDFDQRIDRILDSHMHLVPSTLPAGVTTADFRQSLYVQATDIFARMLLEITTGRIDNARRSSARSGDSSGFVTELEKAKKKTEELLEWAKKKGTFTAKSIEKVERLIVTAGEQLEDLAEEKEKSKGGKK